MELNKGLNHWGDILVVVAYFVAVIAVGIWALCRPNRGNVKNYFLAGRSMPWFAVGASLFSSNIGSEHFVGLAGAGASTGIAMVLYEWFVIFLILLLGWLFLPVYISAGVYTLPEYIQKRHGGKRLRTYLSGLALIMYIITKLAVSIFSGSMFIQMTLGWDMYLSIAVLLVITGLFTILGGLTAVMYTDTLQTIIMVVGSFVVVGIGFAKVDGISGLKMKYFEAIPQIRNNNTTCGLPNKDAFHLFLDPVDGEYPWPGLVIMSSLGCMWYWCCDQVIVQRSLGAKSLSHAKGGALVASCLKIIPLFLIVFPGMISRTLFPDEVACSDPDECSRICDNPVGCSNIAYPKLILEILPAGLRGLLMAVFISAIMSSLTSIFNSASTIFTMDLWLRVRSKATHMELLIVGRVFVAVMCVSSILWIPLVKSAQGGRLFQYMTAMEGYLGAPLGVVFLLSILWKRTTEPAAFWGSVIAHIIGFTRLILEFVYPVPACGDEETRPAVLYKMNFLYFGTMLLFITAVVVVVISLLTQPRSAEELKGVTWWTRLGAKHTTLTPVNEKCENLDKACGLKLMNDEQDENEKDHDKAGVVLNGKQAAPTQEHSTLQRLCSCICGTQNTETFNINIEISQREEFLTQRPVIRKILNVLCIFVIMIVCFLTGFFH